jgi:hypothetical protein
MEAGYRFRFPYLEGALTDLFTVMKTGGVGVSDDASQ